MNVREFLRQTIVANEGGLSTDAADRGNWYNGVCVGSKYGVTGAVLAKHRNLSSVTAAQMAALTIAEAVDIAFDGFYDAPNFDLLVWNQCTASVLDFAYNAGPKQAIKSLQRMIGAADDGEIGAYTARAYGEYIDSHGVEAVAIQWAATRRTFYDHIIAVRPVNARYRNGWFNRANSFLPGTPFWRQWA